MKLDQIWEKVKNKDYRVQLNVAESVVGQANEPFWKLLEGEERSNKDDKRIKGWCQEIRSNVRRLGGWVEDYQQMPFYEEGIIFEAKMKRDDSISKEALEFMWTIVDKVKDIEFNYSEKPYKEPLDLEEVMEGMKDTEDVRFERRMKLREEVEELRRLVKNFLDRLEGGWLLVDECSSPTVKSIFDQLYIIAIMSGEQDAMGYALVRMGDDSERRRLPRRKRSKENVKQTKSSKPTKKESTNIT